MITELFYTFSTIAQFLNPNFKNDFTSDEEMEVNEDHLSDLEDVVEKVTDKLGLCFDKYGQYVPFHIQIEDLDVSFKI